MSHKVITVGPADLLLFVDLYRATFNAAPWKDGWSAEAVAERFEHFAMFPDFLGVGILNDNEPTALAFGWPERWVTDWHFHLKEMLVAHAHQRAGLGTTLLNALELRLRDRGIKRIFLETSAAGEARPFYEKYGFKTLGLVSLAKQVEA